MITGNVIIRLMLSEGHSILTRTCKTAHRPTMVRAVLRRWSYLVSWTLLNHGKDGWPSKGVSMLLNFTCYGKINSNVDPFETANVK